MGQPTFLSMTFNSYMAGKSIFVPACVFDPKELPAHNSSHNPCHVLDIPQPPVQVVQACLQALRGPLSWSSPLEGWPVQVCKLLDMTRQSRVSIFGHVDKGGTAIWGVHAHEYGTLQDRTGCGARGSHPVLEPWGIQESKFRNCLPICYRGYLLKWGSKFILKHLSLVGNFYIFRLGFSSIILDIWTRPFFFVEVCPMETVTQIMKS